MLILILLYFSLKVAELSLSESGHLVPSWLTPHREAHSTETGTEDIAGIRDLLENIVKNRDG